MENLTLDCEEGIPTVQEFFAGFHEHLELVLIAPFALWLMTLAVYVINLRATIDHGQRETKGNIAALLSIYPVSSKKKALKSL